MHNATKSLVAGLEEQCYRMSLASSALPALPLSIILGLVVDLIEGSTPVKKEARATLKKIIGRGRCILNARDFEANLKKGATK